MATATPGGVDGDDEAADAAGAAVVDAGDGEPNARRPGTLAAVAGAIALVYVVWYILDLVALSFDPSVFNAAHEAANNVVSRFVFGLIFLAIAYHGLDGVRRTAIDLRPRWAAHDAGLRAVVAFLTLASWIPITIAIMWPSIRGWFA